MTTDEMILALVKSGKFTLPKGLKREDDEWWSYRAPHAFGLTLRPKQAHDLCAMHFARGMLARDFDLFRIMPSNDVMRTDRADYEYHTAIKHGDSAAAIKALWEATEALK